MIKEVAFFHIKKELLAEFEEAFHQAAHVIASVPGYINHSIHRCIETDTKYMIIVEWENVESHMVNFVQSSLFEEWDKQMGRFFEPNVTMDHYVNVHPSKH
ncbi:antibiotic biosynthesis monooxygenase family protein [Priestia flexa]|uniref:Antibiotic biosynthesis monooxygenase family protein n=1 Tax=Priestia flexa TaxID=86664 RepID=A0ABU4JBU0_9BACI|nr:antibiotic biosynthesis monooxygenase family protein [Priestia flexa]MBY6087643.1 antibiotic biosynthesis monooxygenase [Priestia flexa]MCA1201283.1 antibiotic biosynthesis monooxygenase [Priestia flexa]MCG7312386.1 antibiotic biosynthesis monooxygenase [Priestia flexa]MDW8518449.1 antibiotic biosynthesis monooxygenase family protein [Priestia flexa]WEZ07427.1 antibiotic biosynthesis monooxygenase [Priestia flexa]